ncbi:Uncharacterised protein [Klebsiella pneumoniae subsp. ozaenae]|uniref:YejG-like protein n=1 Tax=Klebsiella pneumoniae subsp. ozaenae TaxID=574 RepID=A0A378A176_KLEPO|nr:Uncharacterised protein [Klebsiella pneumoniae subsp. ozaenae]
MLPGKPSEYTTTLYRTPSAAELSLAGRFAGSRVEPIPQNGAQNENSLVALKLLSPDGEKAWPVMHKLSQALSDIEVDCSVLECEGEPCLFVNLQDEFAATCRLKNFGVAIAEPFSGNNPF